MNGKKKEKMKTDEIGKIHEFVEDWWWGKSVTLVVENSTATVEIQYESTSPAFAFIRGLVVSPEKRRKGIGTKLLNICIQKAHSEGKHFVQLSANKSQEWLVKWYQSQGFIISGVEDKEYVMIKVIGLMLMNTDTIGVGSRKRKELDPIKKYIADNQLTCSNELDLSYQVGKENPEIAIHNYYPWLTPYHAECLAVIAKDIAVKKTEEFIYHRLNDVGDIEIGDVEKFINDYKKAME